MSRSRPLRIAGTDLWTEPLAPGERALRVEVVLSADAVELGIIEYLGIKKRGGGTSYGWRPLHSSWTASQLKTKREAAIAVARKAVA